jgi:D-hydroxyproline dehydrogenase subunit beta
MQPRFLILGAGITGAALAHRLARRGASVTVIDAAIPAAGASGRSFGWVNASFFLSEPHFHLRHAAMTAHRDLAAELKRPYQPEGCLWFEKTGAEFDRMQAQLERFGYPLRLLDRSAVTALEPRLTMPPDRALFFPGEAAVDPAALTRDLLAAASAQGTHLICGLRVLGLIQSDDRIAGIRTEAGDIMADHTVLCTGTGTPELLAPLGLTFPMLSRPGALMVTRPLPPLLHHILATPDQEVRQDAEGHLIAPATASHQADESTAMPAPQAVEEATLMRLRLLFPNAFIRPDRLLLAQRPVPGDGLPAIGPVLPGLSMAVMHSGATLAPLVADILALELSGQGSQPPLASFRPARFFAP